MKVRRSNVGTFANYRVERSVYLLPSHIYDTGQLLCMGQNRSRTLSGIGTILPDWSPFLFIVRESVNQGRRSIRNYKVKCLFLLFRALRMERGGYNVSTTHLPLPCPYSLPSLTREVFRHNGVPSLLSGVPKSPRGDQQKCVQIDEPSDRYYGGWG